MTAEAQDIEQNDACTPQEVGALHEVPISARYRQENLHTTPLAITAVSGAEVANRSFPDAASRSAAVPNFHTHVGDGVQGPTPAISMRGVTAGGYSSARHPAKTMGLLPGPKR